MRTVFAAAVLCTGFTSLAAQTVSATIVASSPIQLSAATGLVSQTSAVAAGVLPPTGSQIASASTAPGIYSLAALGWGTTISETRAQVIFTHTVVSSSTATSTGHIGPAEVVVSLTSTVPHAALLRIQRRDAPFLAVAGTIQVDLDDNGTIDVSDLSLTGVSLSLPMLGGQPTMVRIITEVDLPLGHSQAAASWDLTVEPDNAIDATPVALGCEPQSSSLVVHESFLDNGIDLVAAATNNVHVIGLGLAPFLLPPFQGVPCLVVPATDILVFQPGVPLHVALPAAVRPLTFWVQGVTLDPAGLLPTDAFRIDAH